MQIPDKVRKCVGYVCYKTEPGDGFSLAGTAFLVGIPLNEINGSFVYFVTAKHVIAGIQKKSFDGKVYIRINTTDGKSGMHESHFSDWKSHPNDSSVDAAVISVGPLDRLDIQLVDINTALNEKKIAENEVAAGDEIFITGLFVNHFGNQRNLPIVRTGNIALMPEEKIQTNHFGPIEAFLIEARSIGGLSGSPVFVYLGADRFFNGVRKKSDKPVFLWLGLIHGHWDSKTGTDNLSIDSLSGENVNVGVAIVVPAWKVAEVINQDFFKDQREKEMDRVKGLI